MFRFYAICFLLFTAVTAFTQQARPAARLVDVDSGWANNSVNVVVFRKNSLITHKDTQYIAFYDSERYVVLGKRKTGKMRWQLRRTIYKGNAADAHNSISIMTDGKGYLHLAWDHHNNPLRYCKSVGPGSLELTDKMPMTGELEQRISYPEFFKMPDGDLLFFYRDGSSGQGNLVMNKYNLAEGKWTRVHDNLINGEGQRNAYWQVFVDRKGMIHISWVWRETPDVATNHDMCYARSADGGNSWTTSVGDKYELPIVAATAEYACRIPQNSELINQTSMFADEYGTPFIATYWKDPGQKVPQYQLIYKEDGQWRTQNTGFRNTAFSLSGIGTRRIPVSRPQIIAWKSGKLFCAGVIFRDAERGNKASIALNTDLTKGKWQVSDLTTEAVGSWEPTYDTELWKEKKILNLFIQNVEQMDAEGNANIPAQMVKVLEWRVK